MITFSDLDFAQGKKTITGILILILPVMIQLTGWDIDQGSIMEIVNQVFALLGTVLTIYGLVIKVVRNFKK
jgi:hypothetical protein